MNKQLLSLPLLVGALAAQTTYYGEPPTTVKAAAIYAPLGAAAVGNGATQVYQCRLVANASLPANTYYCCLTVGTASATYAVMSGTFNTVTGVFTKNTDADGINTAFTTSELFALSVTNDMLIAAFDTGAGVRYATRANTSSPFVVQAGLVSGITGVYVDPNFGYVNGKNVLFHSNGTSILFGDFAAGALTNIRTVNTITTTGQVHSPMPANDKGGTTRALTYCDTTPPTSGGTYKLMWASSLEKDAGAPAYKYYDNTSWLENGNASGGTVTIINAPSGTTTYQLGISAVNSSTYPALSFTTVNITSFAPQQAPAATPYVGVTSIGLLATSGIALGGIVVGNYSLTGVTLLPVGLFDNASGTFEQNYPLPPLPAGLKVYYQTFACDPSKCYLSNTGKLEWK